MDAERCPFLSSLSCGLLCLVLLLAVTGLPLEPEAPEPVRPGEGIYLSTAAHPGKPIQIDAAHAVQRPRSAARSHRLPFRGALLPAAGYALPVQPPLPLWLAPAPRADRGTRRTAGARAPPFA